MFNSAKFFMILVSLIDYISMDELESCFYSETLQPGVNGSLFAPGYPNSYPPGTKCRWIIRSDLPIRVTCPYFDIPESPDCMHNVLVLKDAKYSREEYRTCGTGHLDYVSKSNELIIDLKSSNHSTGGYLACDLSNVEKPSKKCQCGWKNPTRIIGGTEVGVNEFPMMAGLVDISSEDVICGGTVINDRQVLTAAHCIGYTNVDDLRVIAGDQRAPDQVDTNSTKLYYITTIDIHADYVEALSDPYDIAVITIFGNFQFGEFIGPACLPFTRPDESFLGANVQALGWGATSFGGATANDQQKISMRIEPDVSCRKNYDNSTDNQFCTYAAGTDTCSSDSGGPALWQNPWTGRVVIIGIIQGGMGCALELVPSINLRVGAFLDWIDALTPPGIENCKLE